MRLAISNIAWDIAEDAAVAALLHKYSVDAIDIAPGKYFPNFAGVTDAELRRVRFWWEDRGISVLGMQSLLFGAGSFNVFGSPDVQSSMLVHLGHVCRIGCGLGATRLVFGSPRNRDRSGLSDTVADAIALEFFRRLGDVARDHGLVVCLEPNPPRYGANFMTTSAETARITHLTGHPAVRMQLDTGAMTINNEDPRESVANYAHLIGHIHASEPGLVPLGDSETDHLSIGVVLSRLLPNHVVTIEMLATTDEPHLVSVERAIRTADHAYRLQRTRNDKPNSPY